jgi:hypothetical protein
MMGATVELQRSAAPRDWILSATAQQFWQLSSFILVSDLHLQSSRIADYKDSN